MTLRPVPILVAALFVFGCTGSRDHAQTTEPAGSPAGPRAPESAGELTHRPEAPVSVRWRVEAEDQGHARLVARLERKALMNAPLQARFVVPDGVVVSPAPEDFVLPPGGPVVIEHTFDVTWRESPPVDLLVTVDVNAGDFGLHGEDAYRFGRPAPVVATPPRRSQEPLSIGGRDLGAPVQVQPRGN